MLAYLLIYSTLNSLVQEAFNIAALNGDQTSANYTWITLTVICGLFLATVVCNCFYFCYDHNNLGSNDYSYCYTPTSLVIQTIGGLLYLIGNNLSRIGNQLYQDYLQCDMACLTRLNIAGIVLVGVALLIFQVTPHLFHLITEGKDTHWFTPMDSITTLVSLDALYSSVVMMIDPQISCSEITRTVSWTFWVICVLGGWLYIAKMAYTAEVISAEKKCKEIVAVVFISIVGVFCYPPYLLLDNSLPFECEFGCSGFEGNKTVNCHAHNSSMIEGSPCCNELAKSGVRLFFAIAVLVLVTLSGVVLHCIHEQTRELSDKVSNTRYSDDCSCLCCIAHPFKEVCKCTSLCEKRSVPIDIATTEHDISLTDSPKAALIFEEEN